MIKVTLITLGRLKERYLRDAAEEYIKRLSRYCDLETVELSPVSLPENPSELQIAAVLEREAELIEKRIPVGAYKVALCVEGKELSSEGLADSFAEKCACGTPMCFIIGSSYGLCERIKKMCDIRLSLSRMTFPHQLFRVMLLEQIYRAFKINEGSTYHK